MRGFYGDICRVLCCSWTEIDAIGPKDFVAIGQLILSRVASRIPYEHRVSIHRPFRLVDRWQDSGALWSADVCSIRNSNQFQIVRRKHFPFRVLHFQSAHGFSGAFVQNLKTFLAAGEEITFSPLAQSNDDREQLSALLG